MRMRPQANNLPACSAFLIGISIVIDQFAMACGGPQASDPTPTAVQVPTAIPDDAAIIAACIRAMKTTPVKDTAGWSDGAIRLYQSALDLADSEIADNPGAIEALIRTDIVNGELTPDILGIMRFIVCPRTDTLLELPPPDEPAQ